jgi:dienelactone hydrolase
MFRLAILLAVLVTHGCSSAVVAQDTVIVGGTVVDVNGGGRQTHDIDDAVIVIRDSHLVAVGQRNDVAIPEGAHLIDARGKYIVPGLIDAFATLNDQSYANAYLYEGVTSIVGVASTRRGRLVRDCDPAPQIYELESIGDEEISTSDAIRRLEALHKAGVRVALLMYRLKPDQVRALIRRAGQLDMATIGELAETNYAEGVAAGLDAVVHTTRYSLDMAPEEMRRAVGQQPFSDKLDSPKWQYYRWLTQLVADDPRLLANAKTFGQGSTALMPTAALLYLDQPFAKNPWQEPVAQIIPRGLVNNPANAITGRHVNDEAHSHAYAAIAQAELLIERAYYLAGATYIAGSGTDVWGTMPGISLHQELELLVRIGLSPRESLAAATANIADAFRWKDVGRVQAGCRADLLVLDRDPRGDVSALKSIRQVVVGGRVLDRGSLLDVPPRTDRENGTILTRKALEIPASCFELNEQGERSDVLSADYEYLENVDIRRITYASDGLRVTGYLAAPRPGVTGAGGPFPAIIYNRGGNREFGSLSPQKVVDILARMASWGYVVVGSQYRGTDGSDGMEQFGGDDVHDVLNLIPLLEGHPRADARRLGMVGGSRGGLMTYLALTKTDRVRAAAIRCGVSDLTNWADGRPEMAEVFNDLIPEFDPANTMSLKSRSPIHWVDKLPRTTPLLLLQGTADWRVSPKSALRMSQSLLERQHPFRLVMLEGSDHGLSEHRDEASALIRNWMNRFVRDGDPLPNMKPHGR